MLNKALRTNDIKPLFFLHNFIRRLHQQLLLLQQESVRHDRMILYRGQQISTTDFENIRMNVGGLLSVSSFLSTTALVNVAEIFSGQPMGDPTVSCIVFEISVDPATCGTLPFADISQYSYFGDGEKEYLFSMGAVFRIDEVRQRDDQVWSVHL